MKLNLLSLAPDTFILSQANLASQFYPKKIFELPCVQELSQVSEIKNQRKLDNLWGLEIHLTSKCQLSCKRCSYGQRNRDCATLQPEVLSRILEAVRESAVESVIFSGGGDPLSWDLGSFDKVLKQDAPYTQTIATNGLGLMQRLNRELLRCVSIVQINVSGYDVNSYFSTTRRNLFDKFVQNVEWLLKNRDKNVTQVTGKVVIDNSNYKQVQEYLKFCHQIGFDVIVIKLAGNFEPGQDVSLTQQQKKELRDLIYSSPIISLYSEKLDAIATDDNSIELSLPGKCWVVEYGLYALIRSNGDIFPCVTSPCTVENSIGNINKADFEEIWKSARHRVIKDKLHKDMNLCKCNLGICRHMRYNFLLDDKLSSCAYVEDLPKTNKHKPTLL